MAKGSKRPNKRTHQEANQKPIMERSETLQQGQSAPPPVPTTLGASGNLNLTEEDQITYSQREIQSTGKSLSKLGKHFIILLCVIALGVLMHFLLVHVFGDPKFFDLIPVRWVIDLGDIAIILAFVTIIIRELWKLEE